jgi:hypothetical protein
MNYQLMTVLLMFLTKDSICLMKQIIVVADLLLLSVTHRIVWELATKLIPDCTWTFFATCF